MQHTVYLDVDERYPDMSVSRVECYADVAVTVSDDTLWEWEAAIARYEEVQDDMYATYRGAVRKEAG